MDLELITKLVILATAIVGLYKAATFNRQKRQSGGAEMGKPSESLGTFSAFFDLIGLFLFMLAFPAFIWAFSWITGNIGKASSRSGASDTAQIVTISDTGSPTEIAYIAAVNIPGSSGRTEALIKVVAFALEKKDFKTATLAANAIPGSSAKTEQLQKVVDAIQAQASQATKPAGVAR